MSERTDISFDAALMMALRADAQRELDSLPTPKQFEEIYPDTLSWEHRGITHTVMGNIPYDEIMKIAEGIR